eukprot:164036-Rhodomonas_salina.1
MQGSNASPRRGRCRVEGHGRTRPSGCGLDRGVWNNGECEEYLGRWKEGEVIGVGWEVEQRQLLVAVNGDTSPLLPPASSSSSPLLPPA